MQLIQVNCTHGVKLLMLISVTLDYRSWPSEASVADVGLSKSACTMQPLQTQLSPPNLAKRTPHHALHADSRFPSFSSFYRKCVSTRSIRDQQVRGRQTKAFAVPCSACLWFLRNFGSVPFRDGYLEVFGFLILYVVFMLALHNFTTSPQEPVSYPFLCAFLFWLCWLLFLLSIYKLIDESGEKINFLKGGDRCW